MNEAPFNWQNRIVEAAGGLLLVEVWNPMARQWERSPGNLRWPRADRAHAEAWIEAENRAQQARNAETRDAP